MSPSFRLGSTSYVYPDRLLPNVERLAPRVQDIEILFFDVSREEDLPSAEDLRRLDAIKREAGLTYSLHTPLSARLASTDEKVRRRGVGEVLKAMELARPLAPECVIVHVEAEDGPADAEAWRARATRSLREILESGIAPADLCVELLDYDLRLLDPAIEALGLSVVIDVGHLHRDGFDFGPVLDRYLARARVIHWHGTDERGRDHRSLTHYPADAARRLLERLEREGWAGVLTLEVFSEADFESSLGRVRAILEPAAC